MMAAGEVMLQWGGEGKMGRKKEVEIGKVILKLRWKISPMILDCTACSLPITPVITPIAAMQQQSIHRDSWKLGWDDGFLISWAIKCLDRLILKQTSKGQMTNCLGGPVARGWSFTTTKGTVAAIKSVDIGEK